MAKVTLDIGESFDMLNQGELRDALKEDRAIRNAVTGVKQVEAFYPLSVVNPAGAASGTGINPFTTPAGMVPSGYYWAVMLVGWEISASNTGRIYKGVPPSTTPAGFGRVLSGPSTAATTGAAAFSKGQAILRGGEQLSVVISASGLLLSCYISAIEVPAERFGELLI